jgi:pteridine reductase
VELEGKIALVTGGASRVGRAISSALAQHGCHLVVHYHRSAQAAEEVVRMARSIGVRAIRAQADLRREEDVEALFASVDEGFDRLDILVNSAADMQAGDLRSATINDWEQTINLNLRAPFLCTQQAARRMGGRSGVIINISDVAAAKTWTRFPVYSISKAGLEMLTRLAARSLGPQIRVNAIAPGLVLRAPDTDPERWENLYRALPLGRPGSPDDVARGVIFLCQNEFITGETLFIDGGRQLI